MTDKDKENEKLYWTEIDVDRQSEEWLREIEEVRAEPGRGDLSTLTIEGILLQRKFPEVREYFTFYHNIHDLIADPTNEWLLNYIAERDFTKNQVLASAGARIYYGGLAKALQDYYNERLRDGYIRTEEEWWLDAEGKPALLHLLTDPAFLKWWEGYLELDLPKKTKSKARRKIVEDLTAKLKPYSGKIQKTDEIGKYSISREKEIPDTKLENIGESTVDSAFDFTYGYPKNKVKALAQEFLKLDDFTKRLLLTEHGQSAKSSRYKADYTIKKLSEESGIPESTLRQRKKRYISELIINVTNDLSKPINDQGTSDPLEKGQKPENIGP